MEQERNRFIAQLKTNENPTPFFLRQLEHWLTEFIQFAQSGQISSWSEVTPSLIKRWQTYLIRAGYDRSSVSHQLAALHQFLEFLVKEGILDENPMRYTNLPTRPRLIFESLTPEEAAQLLAAPETNTPLGLRDRALLELMYCSGMRVSEAIALNVGDLDLEQMQVTIWRQALRRQVLLDEETVHTLTVYLQKGRPYLVSGRASPALFLNYRGGRISKIAINQMIKRYAEAAGLPRHITPQTLAHTLAAHLVDNAAGWRQVRALLSPVEEESGDSKAVPPEPETAPVDVYPLVESGETEPMA